jgi:hypothetical protein
LFGEAVRTPEAQSLVVAALRQGFQTREPELHRGPALARLIGQEQ